MTALLVENFKLIILFLLIGSLVGLSHLGDENGQASAPETAPQLCLAGIGSPLEEANMSVLAHRKNTAAASRLSSTVGFLRKHQARHKR